LKIKNKKLDFEDKKLQFEAEEKNLVFLRKDVKDLDHKIK